MRRSDDEDGGEREGGRFGSALDPLEDGDRGWLEKPDRLAGRWRGGELWLWPAATTVARCGGLARFPSCGGQRWFGAGMWCFSTWEGAGADNEEAYLLLDDLLRGMGQWRKGTKVEGGIVEDKGLRETEGREGRRLDRWWRWS